MSASIRPLDVLWTRNGDPTVVEKKDEQTGSVYTNSDFGRVQDVAKNGIKNGLSPAEREAYQTTLERTKNPDRKQEILDLHKRINAMKQDQTSPRLLKYLESELQYRMLKTEFKPDDYAESPVVMDT